MKSFREFMYEEDNFGQAKKVMRKHSDRLKKLHRQIDKGSGSGEDVNEDKREEKARRSELAKKHGIDMTKPGSRAKLARLMNADTRSKNRKAKGDDRTDKEVRKDRVDDRKTFDRQRKNLEYRKKSKPEIKKSMKKFRDEVRSVNDPAKAPPSREKVRVQVGTKVDKPAEGPKTGRNKPTAAKRADRKSYEAQQRRNAKES